jgi:hypothetical protein
MENFKLPGPIGSDIPFGTLHVWHWAAGQPRARVNISEYLGDVGFVMGRDKITPEEYDTLSHALDAYHRTAPHYPGRLNLCEALRPLPDGESGFYLQGHAGRYALAPELSEALTAAGWIYDVTPDTTYFQVIRGRLFAKYQQIIGSRCLCEVAE